jgi:hypothetical protein
MPPAGLNQQGRLWRFTQDGNDDEVGGAVPSGTILKEPVWARISARKPTLALLEQGLEVPEIFDAVLSAGDYVLIHNDQLEITAPNLSPYLNKKFRVIGIQETSNFDPRQYKLVTLRRLETANSNDLQ